MKNTIYYLKIKMLLSEINIFESNIQYYGVNVIKQRPKQLILSMLNSKSISVRKNNITLFHTVKCKLSNVNRIRRMKTDYKI